MVDSSPEGQKETAIILARWQEGVDRQLAQANKHAEELNGSVHEIELDMKALRVEMADRDRAMSVEMAVVKTKIAIWSAGAGMFGAALASAVVTALG